MFSNQRERRLDHCSPGVSSTTAQGQQCLLSESVATRPIRRAKELLQPRGCVGMARQSKGQGRLSARIAVRFQIESRENIRIPTCATRHAQHERSAPGLPDAARGPGVPGLALCFAHAWIECQHAQCEPLSSPACECLWLSKVPWMSRVGSLVYQVPRGVAGRDVPGSGSPVGTG